MEGGCQLVHVNGMVPMVMQVAFGFLNEGCLFLTATFAKVLYTTVYSGEDLHRYSGLDLIEVRMMAFR